VKHVKPFNNVKGQKLHALLRISLTGLTCELVFLVKVVDAPVLAVQFVAACPNRSAADFAIHGDQTAKTQPF
jgi:hypothetical protein